MPSLARVRDYLIYIGVTAAVLASVFVAVEVGIPKDLFLRWIAFGIFTLLLFGHFIINSRSYWDHRAFWIGVIVAAIVHSIFFTFILRSGFQMGIWAWIVCVVFETALLISFRTALHRDHRAKGFRE